MHSRTRGKRHLVTGVSQYYANMRDKNAVAHSDSVLEARMFVHGAQYGHLIRASRSGRCL
jgi:hypothetical protein